MSQSEDWGAFNPKKIKMMVEVTAYSDGPKNAPGATMALSWASRVYRAVCAFMAAFFFMSVALQWNDPDPVGWMLIYGASGALSAAAAFGRGRWEPAALVSLVALIWAGTLWPHVRMLRAEDVFSEFGMKDVSTEEARELGGLLIVALWCGGLALVLRKAAPSPARKKEA